MRTCGMHAKVCHRSRTSRPNAHMRRRSAALPQSARPAPITAKGTTETPFAQLCRGVDRLAAGWIAALRTGLLRGPSSRVRRPTCASRGRGSDDRASSPSACQSARARQWQCHARVPLRQLGSAYFGSTWQAPVDPLVPPRRVPRRKSPKRINVAEGASAPSDAAISSIVWAMTVTCSAWGKEVRATGLALNGAERHPCPGSAHSRCAHHGHRCHGGSSTVPFVSGEPRCDRRCAPAPGSSRSTFCGSRGPCPAPTGNMPLGSLVWLGQQVHRRNRTGSSGGCSRG